MKSCQEARKHVFNNVFEIVDAMPKSRDRGGNDCQTVEQIAAKGAIACLVSEITMGRTENAYICFLSTVGTHRAEGLGL